MCGVGGVGGGCTAVVFALCHVGVSEVESGGSIQSVRGFFFFLNSLSSASACRFVPSLRLRSATPSTPGHHGNDLQGREALLCF